MSDLTSALKLCLNCISYAGYELFGDIVIVTGNL